MKTMNNFILTTIAGILLAGTNAKGDLYQCNACPAGYKCDGSSKTACPAGTYSLTGASKCTPCPAGTYSKYSASPSCTKCAETYWSNEGATSCGKIKFRVYYAYKLFSAVKNLEANTNKTYPCNNAEFGDPRVEKDKICTFHYSFFDGSNTFFAYEGQTFNLNCKTLPCEFVIGNNRTITVSTDGTIKQCYNNSCETAKDKVTWN